MKEEITNNQETITKQIPIPNNQYPNTKFGYWGLIIGYCLVIVSCILVISIVDIAGGEEEMARISLPKPRLKSSVSLEETIAKRRSVRSYSSRELTDAEISQLLWACQGITGRGRLRAAPSAGALYPLEIYLVKEDGIFLYIPETHQLEKKSSENVKGRLKSASWNQGFIEEAAANVVICAVYERVSSKYGTRGVRYADIEAGHAAENVHLQAVALGLASCPVGAFNDSAVSEILSLPKDEKPVYIIPVGSEKE